MTDDTEIFDEETSAEENGGEGGKKPVYMKQFLVSGSKNVFDESEPRIGAFILATCAKTARDEFKERFGLTVMSCVQTAETSNAKEHYEGRDLWESGDCWTVTLPRRDTDASKRFFEKKRRCVLVQQARTKAGIDVWGEETSEQRRVFEAELKRLTEIQ